MDIDPKKKVAFWRCKFCGTIYPSAEMADNCEENDHRILTNPKAKRTNGHKHPKGEDKE